MATYSIYYAGISLNTHQKFTLAQAITRVHANVTGAEALRFTFFLIFAGSLSN